MLARLSTHQGNGSANESHSGKHLSQTLTPGKRHAIRASAPKHCQAYSANVVAAWMPARSGMIKHNLLELLEDGETVVPLAGTDMAVLWRTSLLDPVSSYTRGHAARLTLIDLIPELFGIASLWLKDDFFQNYSRHFEHTGEYEGPTTLATLRARKAAKKPTSLLNNQSGGTPSAPAPGTTAHSLVRR